MLNLNYGRDRTSCVTKVDAAVFAGFKALDSYTPMGLQEISREHFEIMR